MVIMHHRVGYKRGCYEEGMPGKENQITRYMSRLILNEKVRTLHRQPT